MHIKRSKMPKTWPIARKGTKYIAVASHSHSKGISLLFLFRDILKIAKTRKEVRKILLGGDVMINNKVRKDENFPVQVFDVVSLEKAGKNYKLEIVNKKFELKEISDKEADKKIIKICGKKILSGGRVQMNLEDGQNLIVKEKFAVNDSIVLNTKKGKIEKILSLKEGANIEVVSGKHAGEKGKIVGIEAREKGRVYLIKLKKGEVTLPLKTLLVIE